MRVTPNRKLAAEIALLLDIPHREAAKLLRTILITIKEALLRGESVKVPGFGTFKVVTRKPRPTPRNYITHYDVSPILQYYEPRRIAVFRPAIPLLAMLNLPSDGYEPTFVERRVQKTWRLPLESEP